MTTDSVFYRGNSQRRIPAKLAADTDTAQFIEEIMSWRGHLTRTGQPFLWPSGLTAPDNTIALPSSAVSRTKYAALFSVYGTTFGVGDGSTTFDLPTITAPVGAVVLVQT